MPLKKQNFSKEGDSKRKFYEYDSSEAEYSLETPKLVIDNYKNVAITKGIKGNTQFNKQSATINQSLHFIGAKVYHSQDKEYYKQKPTHIKSIEPNKNRALFKSIFREDNSSSTDFSLVKV